MAHPIYIITPRTVEAGATYMKRLVRAPNAAQALRHVANELNVARASQDDLVTALGEGIKVEDAQSENKPADGQKA